MLEKELFKEIKKIKITESPIAIQIPEGLKQYSLKILDAFKKNKPSLFIDPCYGACDTKDLEAKYLGFKVLIHFGHYKMNSQKIKTYFIPINYKLKKEQIKYIIKNILKLNFKKINLVTTIQYIENIKEIKNKLKKQKIQIIDAKKTKRVIKHMVLGCDSTTITDTKNPIIFIGDGVFHINNIAFIYKNQQIITINPITKKIKKIEITDEFIRQRYVNIALARKAEKFAILVSTKKGQNRMGIAIKIKKFIETKNKKAYILISDYIKQEYLYGIKVDCFINTACPRITYDDYKQFKKPIISVTEIENVFDLKKELKIDQII
ncbi:MAG: diphthamide biosynthesis enzyme Dph2 [Candidatus ainarchaeum sp.]|nr:diphthamide biosynthesis enzyme Dph2 [Candidatus ainarchaeum sp.]MDD3975986.1 diphthamide biosynthesis enzyme Dph2 [Candidatus ainarchaeum sp.]